MGFGDGIFYEPVEAGPEGLAEVAVDDGAFDAEFSGEVGDVAVFEVGLVFEVGDDGEVAFSVGEEFGVVGVVGEVGVFGVDEGVELGFGGDGGGVDGGVPEVEGDGLGFGWWHGRSLLLGVVFVL